MRNKAIFWTTLILLAGCGRHAAIETPLQAAQVDYLTVVEAAALTVEALAKGTAAALDADAVTPAQAEKMEGKLTAALASVKAARERYRGVDDPTQLRVGLGVLAAETLNLIKESETLGIAAAASLGVYAAILEAARKGGQP